MIYHELRHQVWRLIEDYFPGRVNRELRNKIFNCEFDLERVTNDCRNLVDTIGFSSPELALNKLGEIHALATEVREAERLAS